MAKFTYTATGFGSLASVSKYTTGTAGSVGPAGRTTFGFFFPGFQQAVTVSAVLRAPGWRARPDAPDLGLPVPGRALRPNPLYGADGELRWPSPRYAADYAERCGYLPPRLPVAADLAADGATPGAAFVGGMQTAFTAAAGIALLAVVFAVLLPSRVPTPGAPEPAVEPLAAGHH